MMFMQYIVLGANRLRGRNNWGGGGGKRGETSSGVDKTTIVGMKVRKRLGAKRKAEEMGWAALTIQQPDIKL